MTLSLTSLAACGDGKNDTEDGSSSSASTSSSSSSTASTGATEPTGGQSTDATESTDASDATGGPNPTFPSSSSSGTSDTTTGGEADGFGFICVVLKKAESEESDPFVGTETIRLTLEYETCLSDYYSKVPLEEAYDPEVLEAWGPRLCNEPVDAPLVACEVEALMPNHPEGGPNSLTVHYTALDAAQIEGRALLWGPAPLAATAGCEPTAKFVGIDSILGGSNIGPLWQAQSWDNPVGLVKSEASGCIEVAVAKVQ